jgi:hypothetical protein
MHTKSVCAIGLAAALFGLLLVRFLAAGDAPPGDAQGDIKPEKFKPQWHVGQKWYVETVTTQTQARRDPKQAPKSKPVKWQFQVQGIEKVHDRDCYKVQIDCQAEGRKQPVTTIWTDKQTMTLQKMQTQLPVQGDFKQVTEQYKPSEQGAPVLAPLTALPLELPVFKKEMPGAKALDPETYSYEAMQSPEGAKEPGEVSFAFDVRQQLKTTTSAKAKGLVDEKFSKDLDKAALVEVEIQGPHRKVQQLWQAEQPWPVYSNNGTTEARLIEVIPAP